MNNDILDKELLTADEAAEYLGVSRDVIYIMAREKDIPHTRIGLRKYIFLKSSINEWLKEKEKETMQG